MLFIRHDDFYAAFASDTVFTKHSLKQRGQLLVNPKVAFIILGKGTKYKIYFHYRVSGKSVTQFINSLKISKIFLGRWCHNWTMVIISGQFTIAGLSGWRNSLPPLVYNIISMSLVYMYFIPEEINRILIQDNSVPMGSWL